MKTILFSILRFLLTPFRLFSRRRNGVTDATVQRRPMPNDILLGLARQMIREGGTDQYGHPIAHHTATILAKGYSMRPFLEHERDKVQLAFPTQPLQVGDAVLAEISPGRYVLHRIIQVQDQHLTLMGDGNLRGTETCRLSDVAGIVTHYIRPRRTIPASSPSLRRRIRLWRRLLPIRRYLLFIYKATL